MIAKKPADRFASMSDVIAALQSASTNEPMAPSDSPLMAPSSPTQADAALAAFLQQPFGRTATKATPSTGTASATANAAVAGSDAISAADAPTILASGAVDTETTLRRLEATRIGRGIPRWAGIAAGALCTVGLLGWLAAALWNRNNHKPPVVAARSPSAPGWPADAPKPAIAPFDAEQAQKHQEEWAAYLKVPVEYTNSLGMKFRLIPPGEFDMGCTDDEVQEALTVTARHPDSPNWKDWITSSVPKHRVVLTRAFYLGVHEVTQGNYRRVTGENPSGFPAPGAAGEELNAVRARLPVDTVTWHDAVQFCLKLNGQEQLGPTQRAVPTFTNTGYRLPTEAEWEFACRAGTATKYWIADEQRLSEAAWFGGTSTQATGSRLPNSFGLHDVHGNVWEWCEDDFVTDAYASRRKAATDPFVFADVPQKVVRGGGWDENVSNARSALRFRLPPDYRSYYHGFRAAISVDAVQQALEKPVIAGWHNWPADAPKPAIAPFDAKQAKKHQQEWAAYLEVPVEYTNSLGMKFVLIPPGEFLMGSTSEEIEDAVAQAPGNEMIKEHFRSEQPRHRVVLTSPIYLSQCEVTQKD